MSADRPNILLITSDQQHYGTLGVINKRIQTPNLDRLAGEGVRFDRAYCCNPVCSPSRSSIITGLYPAWHHCWTIGVKLPEDVPTVGDILRDHGYATAIIGKCHFHPVRTEPGSESLECHDKLRDLDFWRGFHGPWYGFDHVELSRNHGDESLVGAHYALWMEKHGLANWPDFFRKWPREQDAPRRRHSWDLPQEYHYTRWTGERAVANLEGFVNQGRPFLLWASFHDPHPPYLAPEPWASMYRPEDMEPGRLTDGELDGMPPHFAMTQEEDPDFSAYRETYGSHGLHSHRIDEELLRKDMAVYYGMVSFMDQEIGRILDAVDRLGLADNTLVVFTTDHGHFLGQHGLVAKGPFHYEDMVRVPMLVRYPPKIPAGELCSGLQSLIDYSPTFLSAACIPIPGLMQGVNQFEVWCGRVSEARDHVIVENRHEPTKVHLRTYVDERYKVTLYRDEDHGELFDLEEDPEEVSNLWDDPRYTDLKACLLHRFLQAELKREPTRMPRIAYA